MNRYTRDEDLQIALDMADIATLNARDRPNGVILPNALCVKWLQNLLDMFHQRYPFASDVVPIAMRINSNQEDLVLLQDPNIDPTTGLPVNLPPQSIYLPADFSIEVTNGIVAQYRQGQFYRVRKRSFQEWLEIHTWYRSQPASQPRILAYTVLEDRVKITPMQEEPQPVQMWYYRVPPLLHAAEKPAYPGDWTLIEYVRLRALEWARHPTVIPGAAQAYAEDQLSADRQAGLLQKAEFDQLKLGGFNELYQHEAQNVWGWMGPWVA